MRGGATDMQNYGKSFGEIHLARPEGGGRHLRAPRAIEIERLLQALRYLARRRMLFDAMKVKR